MRIKPLHCEVHRQEGEIALPDIAQCLCLEQIHKTKRKNHKLDRDVFTACGSHLLINLQWRIVGEGTGLLQARQVKEGERRCWKKLQHKIQYWPPKQIVLLRMSSFKHHVRMKANLLQEEHTPAAAPREKTSR